MNSSPWQFDRKPWYGCSISTIVHLALIIAISLLLIPSDERSSELLEVEVTLVDTGNDLAEFDVLTAELDSLADQVTDDSDAPSIFEATDALIIAPSDEALAFGIADGSGGDGSSTSGGNSRSGGVGQTSFFGTVATGNIFIYILDVSPSMNASRGQRLERAVLELLNSLDQLGENQSFSVILFGWKTRRMFDNAHRYPAPIPANIKNKRRLRHWLARIQTIPGTDPREALAIGLKLEPSAIFFLSDGEFNKPNHGDPFAGESSEAEDIIAAQRSSAIPIHTVAFEDPSCEARMNGIATMTNGQHRFVPAPPGSVTASTTSRVSEQVRATVRSFRFSAERFAAPPDTTLAGAVDEALEARALYRFRLAKMLEDTAKPTMARRYYEQVAEDFPDTQAAKQALASLQNLVDTSSE